MKRAILLVAVVVASLETQASARTVAISSSGEGGCPWPASFDAPAAAPKNHRVLFENERVRVLDVVVDVGSREPVHAHCWPSVLYVISRGKLRERDAAGKVIREEREAPPASAFPIVQWLAVSPPHSIENLDSQPIHLLRVELKQ